MPESSNMHDIDRIMVLKARFAEEERLLTELAASFKQPPFIDQAEHLASDAAWHLQSLIRNCEVRRQPAAIEELVLSSFDAVAYYLSSIREYLQKIQRDYGEGTHREP